MPKQFTVPQAYSTEPRPAIELTAVNSSQIAAIGYDPQTKVLAVTFTRGAGAMYCYPGVDPATFEAFKAAESAGSFFGQHIKHLPFEKFPPEVEAAAGEQQAEG